MSLNPREILRVVNLTKRFGGLQALHKVSMSVWEGETLGIIGPNGAGKTTLLNIISGFLHGEEGEIYWMDQRIEKLRPHEIASLKIIRTFQIPRIFKKISVMENMISAFHLIQDGNQQWVKRSLLENRAAQLLKIFEMEGVAGHLGEKLPHGARRKLGIAMALACEPKLLLVDEPATGLNPTEIKELVAIFEIIKRKQITLCIIDHVLSFLSQVADRFIVLNFGEKIKEGTATEVQNDPRVIEAYLGRRRLV